MAKKFLCICQGGNVRSAALKNILNYAFGQDAIAASGEKNSPELLHLLHEWADYTIVMSQEVMERWIPQTIKDSPKTCLVDVGPDMYGSPFHETLNSMLYPVVQAWKQRGWDLGAPTTNSTDH
jgi:hypothetical protein